MTFITYELIDGCEALYRTDFDGGSAGGVRQVDEPPRLYAATFAPPTPPGFLILIPLSFMSLISFAT